MRPTHRRDRAAFIVEEWEPGRWLGVFSCNWQERVPRDPDGTPYDSEDGPSGLTLAEALAWADARADAVIVRIGSEHFSAGRVRLGKYPAWPGGDGPGPRPAR